MRSEKRELDEIDEWISKWPLESRAEMLNEKSKWMRRAGLESKAVPTNRQRRKLPSTGARIGRSARGVVIAYEPGQCVRRTGNAQHWRLNSPGTEFPRYLLTIAS